MLPTCTFKAFTVLCNLSKYQSNFIQISMLLKDPYNLSVNTDASISDMIYWTLVTIGCRSFGYNPWNRPRWRPDRQEQWQILSAAEPPKECAHGAVCPATRDARSRLHASWCGLRVYHPSRPVTALCLLSWQETCHVSWILSRTLAINRRGRLYRAADTEGGTSEPPPGGITYPRTGCCVWRGRVTVATVHITDQGGLVPRPSGQKDHAGRPQYDGLPSTSTPFPRAKRSQAQRRSDHERRHPYVIAGWRAGDRQRADTVRTPTQ